MYLHNFRLNFATNSSSTHSVILLDSIHSNKYIEDRYDNSSFGWDWFTVKSKEGVVNYLETSLLECLRNTYGNDVGNILAESLCKSIEDVDYASVDHQSQLTFPCSFYSVSTNQPEIDLNFYNDFKEHLINKNVLILGGNDNDNDSHPLSDTGEHLDILPVEQDSTLLVSRYDETYNFYTLFNLDNGTKMRVSFDNERITRSEYPELVDIKITDYCNFGCSFCYQASSIEGSHANIKDIKNILSGCREAGVFEIAYGGGEPTSHPEFLNILEETKNYKITPTFTTKNMEWLKDSLYVYKVMQCAKAFAYSVSSLTDLKIFLDSIQDRLDDKTLKKSQVTIHLVLGTIDRNNFNKTLRLAFKHNIKVTLLGFKTTGLGESYKQISSEWWLDVYKELIEEDSTYKWKALGVDTVVVQQYKTQLDLAKINPTLYYATEGSFSCYIDAVAKKIAPSSFCSHTDYLDLPLSWNKETVQLYKNDFKSIFQQLHK